MVKTYGDWIDNDIMQNTYFRLSHAVSSFCICSNLEVIVSLCCRHSACIRSLALVFEQWAHVYRCMAFELLAWTCLCQGKKVVKIKFNYLCVWYEFLICAANSLESFTNSECPIKRWTPVAESIFQTNQNRCQYSVFRPHWKSQKILLSGWCKKTKC